MNLEIINTNKFQLNQNRIYQMKLKIRLKDNIFFLQYLSESFQNMIHQNSIHIAEADTAKDISIAPQENHLMINGSTGKMKLNDKISRKLKNNKIFKYFFIIPIFIFFI